MNILETILDAIGNLGNGIIDGLVAFMEFLARPFALLLSLLEGIFYFLFKILEVLIEVIMLFGALFQFLFALATGLMRTLGTWLGFVPSSYSIPNEAQTGLEVFMETIGGTGFNTLLPTVFIFIVWIGFIYKLIQLIGGKGSESV